MHAPFAIYTAMARHLLTARRMHVQLEVIERVVRIMPYAERAPNCWVCMEVDAPAFVAYWLERVQHPAARG